MESYNKKFQEDKLHNTTLIESDNFRIVPSVGSIVEGWVLLIPKKHYISFSEMDENLIEEANTLSEKVYRLLSEIYDCEIVSFENGANSVKNQIGCGVDYAHIHFVPINVNLKSIIESEYGDVIKWDKVYSLNELNRFVGNSYFYLNFDSQQIVCCAPYPKSQLIRKHIASFVGVPDKYDWKKNPFEDNVLKTINKLQSVIKEENECIFA